MVICTIKITDRTNLKIFLNEEIPRLRESVNSSLESKEIKSDKEMSEKTRRVLELLANTSKRQVDNKFVHEILKIQNLAKELK